MKKLILPDYSLGEEGDKKSLLAFIGDSMGNDLRFKKIIRALVFFYGDRLKKILVAGDHVFDKYSYYLHAKNLQLNGDNLIYTKAFGGGFEIIEMIRKNPLLDTLIGNHEIELIKVLTLPFDDSIAFIRKEKNSIIGGIDYFNLFLGKNYKSFDDFLQEENPKKVLQNLRDEMSIDFLAKDHLLKGIAPLKLFYQHEDHLYQHTDPTQQILCEFKKYSPTEISQKFSSLLTDMLSNPSRSSTNKQIEEFLYTDDIYLSGKNRRNPFRGNYDNRGISSFTEENCETLNSYGIKKIFTGHNIYTEHGLPASMPVGEIIITSCDVGWGRPEISNKEAKERILKNGGVYIQEY